MPQPIFPMQSILSHQLNLLQHIETVWGKPLNPRLRQAFLSAPRHLFVPRFIHPMTQQWIELEPQQLEQYLPILYTDRALAIYQPPNSPFVATISQPLLVLQMLDLLDIQPGHAVYEIGTGSGWNAALIGQLAGPQGRVYSTEIFPDLAHTSQQALLGVGGQSVTVLAADGSLGYEPGAPYDRIIFTAGSYDIPLAIHQQLKEDGLLLAVLKLAGGGDDLVLFKKQQGVLVSQHASAVLFVPMLGTYRSAWRDGMDLTTFLAQQQLTPEPVEQVPFWWGSRSSENYMPQTEGIRSFLQLSQPGYRVFVDFNSATPFYFGLYDEVSQSLVAAKGDSLISYGGLGAKTRLLDGLSHWIRIGMPSS
ncbi:MAG: hypothetical protein EOO88_49965, partial [Pedobacter sp.]